MNEEELKKGCGKKYVHSQGYDICGEHYGDGSVALCPNCSGKLEGFQKGKLEERNRIEDLIIDMRFKIQNRLNNYFNIDTRTLLFIYNKELSQLQKEIGGMK